MERFDKILAPVAPHFYKRLVELRWLTARCYDLTVRELLALIGQTCHQWYELHCLGEE